MTTSFVRKSRNEMIKYSRNNVGVYTSSEGMIVESPPNQIRLNYDKYGYLKGIKFGNDDTAVIPSGVNTHWNSVGSSGATIIAIGQAPQGVTWFKCGKISIEGIDAHKLHIIEIPTSEVSMLEDSIKIFPNQEDMEEDCHLLLVKYYHETGIDFGVEKEAMTEFNDFLHGAWK